MSNTLLRPLTDAERAQIQRWQEIPHVSGVCHLADEEAVVLWRERAERADARIRELEEALRHAIDAIEDLLVRLEYGANMDAETGRTARVCVKELRALLASLSQGTHEPHS